MHISLTGRHLTYFDASRLYCDEADEEPFDLAAIRSIDLSENALGTVDGLGLLVAAVALVISRNSLRAVPLSLPRKLRHLNISGNELQSLRGIEACAQLQTLDVSANFLHNFTEGQLPRGLAELRAARNCVASLQGLNGLAKLSVLDLSGNDVRADDGDAARATLRTLPALRHVDMRGNPCNAADMRRLCRSAVVKLSTYNGATAFAGATGNTTFGSAQVAPPSRARTTMGNLTLSSRHQVDGIDGGASIDEVALAARVRALQGTLRRELEAEAGHRKEHARVCDQIAQLDGVAQEQAAALADADAARDALEAHIAELTDVKQRLRGEFRQHHASLVHSRLQLD
jgi:hypothetical protein